MSLTGFEAEPSPEYKTLDTGNYLRYVRKVKEVSKRSDIADPAVKMTSLVHFRKKGLFKSERERW